MSTIYNLHSSVLFAAFEQSSDLFPAINGATERPPVQSMRPRLELQIRKFNWKQSEENYFVM